MRGADGNDRTDMDAGGQGGGDVWNLLAVDESKRLPNLTKHRSNKTEVRKRPLDPMALASLLLPFIQLRRDEPLLTTLRHCRM